MLTKNEQTLA